MIPHKLCADWIYLLMALIDGLALKVTFSMSAIYRVEAVGMDVLQLVLLGTMLETSVFLFEIPTGIIADVYSRRLSVIIGIGVMGAGFILEGTLPIVWTVMLAQVTGIGMINALTILGAIGTIERFEQARDLVGYAGLGKRTLYDRTDRRHRAGGRRADHWHHRPAVFNPCRDPVSRGDPVPYSSVIGHPDQSQPI